MQHIGIAEDYPCLPSDVSPLIPGSIAVEGGEIFLTEQAVTKSLVEAAQLVLSQRLGGKQVKGATSPLAKYCLQHRNVIAQCLAAGAGGSHHYILSPARQIHRLCLVGIKGR